MDGVHWSPGGPFSCAQMVHQEGLSQFCRWAEERRRGFLAVMQRSAAQCPLCTVDAHRHTQAPRMPGEEGESSLRHLSRCNVSLLAWRGDSPEAEGGARHDILQAPTQEAPGGCSSQGGDGLISPGKGEGRQSLSDGALTSHSDQHSIPRTLWVPCLLEKKWQIFRQGKQILSD